MYTIAALFSVMAAIGLAVTINAAWHGLKNWFNNIPTIDDERMEL